MTDRAYGYFELQLFSGALILPLQLCTSYPASDYSKIPTKTGVDGRPTNRIFVLAKEGCEKIKNSDDIEKVLQWGEWETYLNTGTATNPQLTSLDEYEGLKDLIDKNKERSKERDISVGGIYPLSELKIKQYNGRHFHTYPKTSKMKDSEKYHNIYRLLALYLKSKEAFVLCTFFSKGEELGALYEDNGILRIAGLYASDDLKPVLPIQKFKLTKGVQKVANEKFDKLYKEDEKPEFFLEWTKYVCDTLEKKGINKKFQVKQKIAEKDSESLKDLFESIFTTTIKTSEVEKTSEVAKTAKILVAKTVKIPVAKTV
jgi:hypothetical protein